MEEVPRNERRAAPRGLLVVAAGSAAIAAACVATIDQPVARWLGRCEPHPVWVHGTELLEWAILLPIWRFALPVALVGGMLAAVAVARWRGFAARWMFIAGVHLVSMMTMARLKDVTGRLRPAQWLKQRGVVGDDTFGWQDGVSFPSGHVAIFASVAIPLAVVFPRLRLPLAVVVGFVMLARIGVDAHFVSDTIASITLVATWAWVMGWLVRPCLPPAYRR